MPGRADGDRIIRQNLILMTVKNVRRTGQDGRFELSVMTKGTNWRRELLSTPLWLKPGFNLENPQNLASEISLKTASHGRSLSWGVRRNSSPIRCQGPSNSEYVSCETTMSFLSKIT